MFLFNSEDVYIGYSLDELAKVRECLAVENIKYKYRIVNLSGSTNRGRVGSYGGNKNYERQYYVSVQKKDSEKAKYVVNKALHNQ